MIEGGEPLAPSRRVLLALAGFAAILFLLAAGLAAAGVGTEIWSAVPTSQHSMPTTEGTARFMWISGPNGTGPWRHTTLMQVAPQGIATNEKSSAP